MASTCDSVTYYMGEVKWRCLIITMKDEVLPLYLWFPVAVDT